MLSYWEKQHFLQYDVIIVGSGITGLSAAISIKERSPGKEILVLERGILPTGASTKNAGFACIGSLTEILDDLQHMSEQEVLSLVELRRNGLRKLRDRLGDATIDYAERGSYELLGKEDARHLTEMDRVNDLLYPVLEQKAFIPADALISSFGFHPEYTKHLIENTAEGELNAGKMMRALLRLAQSKGIEIKTGCNVTEVLEGNSSVEVLVEHPHLREQVAFRAEQVVICTNAFTTTLFPDIALQPGRGQVLITQPIDNLPFSGIFHFDKGYYYFRRLGDRILLGGGRNLDIAGETSTRFEYNDIIRQDLLDKLKYIILPGSPTAIEDWWTGIMAFGPTKFPVVQAQSERIFLGVRMGGMGVAIGSEIGEKLAELVLG